MLVAIDEALLHNNISSCCCLFKQYISIEYVIVVGHFMILFTNYIIWVLNVVYNFYYYNNMVHRTVI